MTGLNGCASRNILCVFPRYTPSFGTFQHSYNLIGVQAFIIAAGNLKVLPLTGVTLPFISYGGSSLLANAVVVGLLLALSDKGVEPPPPPSTGGWRARLRREAA